MINKTKYVDYVSKETLLEIDENTGERIGFLEGYVGYGCEFEYLYPGLITTQYVITKGE